ncbi:hypothetical protein PF003_g1416 [Phytophthora fragariae]|nr:hypothetical protein PF003_g1416 [Phytophthora fragariae]
MLLMTMPSMSAVSVGFSDEVAAALLTVVKPSLPLTIAVSVTVGLQVESHSALIRAEETLSARSSLRSWGCGSSYGYRCRLAERGADLLGIRLDIGSSCVSRPGSGSSSSTTSVSSRRAHMSGSFWWCTCCTSELLHTSENCYCSPCARLSPTWSKSKVLLS